MLNELMTFLNEFDRHTLALIIGFDVLLVATFCRKGGWRLFRRRKTDDWVLDLSGLFIQGTLIPWLQVAVVIGVLALTVPQLAGSLTMHPVLAFLFCFVLVDYGYYWNHRLFHHKRFWAVHKVHHSAPQMDVFVTSRNTLWTSFFIVYLWANGVMLFLLNDPTYYVIAITLTAILDLWRHSNINPSGALARLLGSVLVLPRDHAWHHSQDIYDVNFGANLNIWDRIHGTWYQKSDEPKQIGLVLDMGLMAKLWWPFK